MRTMSVSEAVKHIGEISNPSEPVLLENRKSGTRSVVLPYALYEEMEKLQSEIKSLKREALLKEMGEAMRCHAEHQDEALGGFVQQAGGQLFERLAK